MLKTFFIGLTALFLFSCAAVPVDIDYDETVVFTKLHHFAWAGDAPPKSNNEKIDSDTLLHDRLHGEIEAWLARHGYAKTAPGRADFLATYRVLLETRSGTVTSGGYYGYPLGWGGGYYGRPYGGMNYAYPSQYSYDYRQATLIIDMLDPKTRKLMWRGAVNYDAQETLSPEQKREKIAWAVRYILQNFPPQKPAR
jgi:hypothetical protein